MSSFPLGDDKRRTRVACNTCRSKKIKCNGQIPCGNCLQQNRPNCSYEEKRKPMKTGPRQVNKTTVNNENMKVMEKRLTQMESVILKLCDKLGSGNSDKSIKVENGYSSGSQNEGDETIDTRDDEEEEEEEDDDDDDEGEGEGDDEGDDDDEEDIVNERNHSGNEGVNGYHKHNHNHNHNHNHHSKQDPKSAQEKVKSAKNNLKTAQNNLKSIQKNQSNPVQFDISGYTCKDPVGGDFSSKQKKGNIQNSLVDNELSQLTLKEHYFGAHSMFSICSDKSTEWIAKSMPQSKKEVFAPFKRLTDYCGQIAKTFFVKWLDPISINETNKVEYLQKPIVDNSSFVFALLKRYYNGGYRFICPLEKIIQTFEDYYKPEGGNLNNSRLLLMCLTMSYVICCELDELTVKELSGDSTENMISCQYGISQDDLIKQHDHLMDSCVLLYHRVSVITQGVDTIQAILMLVKSIESGTLDFNITYMLMPTAIMTAQDMGLNRPESFIGLSPEEVRLKRAIWMVCRMVDIESCFRSGKPPILDSSMLMKVETDVELFFEDTEEYFCVEGTDNSNFFFVKQPYPSYLRDKYGVLVVCLHYYYVLSELRRKSYYCLFSNNAHLHSFDSLSLVLIRLNHDAELISSNIDEALRPKFYDDPMFAKLQDHEGPEMAEGRALLYGVFFFNLMVTNRVPFMINLGSLTPEHNMDFGEFRMTFLRSARTLLHLGRIVNYKSCNITSLNFILFYHIGGFLGLVAYCLNNPTHPESFEDAKLLVSVSRDIFGITNPSKLHSVKFGMSYILMNFYSRVVLELILSKQGIDISMYDNQWDDFKATMPEIFKGRRKKTAVPMGIKSGLDGGYHGSEEKGKFHPNSPHRPFLQTSSSSPSYNPSLANIINPESDYRRAANDLANNAPPVSNSEEGSYLSSPGFFADNLNDFYVDDSFASLFNSQVNHLPNIFYDNNLGVPSE